MLTAAASEQLHQECEEFLRDHVAAAVRAWLTEVLVIAKTSLRGPSMTMRELSDAWLYEVDTTIADAFTDAYDTILREYAAGAVTASVGRSVSERFRDWLLVTINRLTFGLIPPLPDDAFAAVTEVVITGAELGWSTAETTTRLAAVLDWEPMYDYWAAQREIAKAEIDTILDAIGPPGTPARETARLVDPRVTALQRDMADITKRLDASSSHWQMRAERIIRTESTGLYNNAALDALEYEGNTHKEWLAAHDERTRIDHAMADGQVVPLRDGFIVGDDVLFFPGDPGGSAGQVVNCRCTVIGANAPS